MDIEDMVSFMVAASDAVKDRGKVYEFTCPLVRSHRKSRQSEI